MRIIAGQLKGRQFVSPSGRSSHPMSEKMRGGLFNALGDISNLSVLDAFAGSGALGYEAFSRGAKPIVLIEKSASAQNAIQKNIRLLSLNAQVKLIKASLGGWLDTSDIQFDLVFCDPPYHQLQTALIKRAAKQCLKSSGTLVLSWPGKQVLPELPDLRLVLNKNYGDAQLGFYQLAEGSFSDAVL